MGRKSLGEVKLTNAEAKKIQAKKRATDGKRECLAGGKNKKKTEAY